MVDLCTLIWEIKWLSKFSSLMIKAENFRIGRCKPDFILLGSVLERRNRSNEERKSGGFLQDNDFDKMPNHNAPQILFRDSERW